MSGSVKATRVPLALLIAAAISPAHAAEPVWAGSLQRAFYEFEVAGYCGLVTEAVGSGFQREVARLRAGLDIDRATWERLRGEAWQAAHEEWQNRGLGGYRRWCETDGQRAAGRFR